MNPDMETLRCAIIRGGTSKGVFIKSNELPSDSAKRDAVIRAVYGSPDLRQIDGLGGADVLTSKLAIIGPPSREDADIDYTFVQVGIDTELVNFNGSCGNIASAVGPYAVDEGYVKAEEPITKVRVHLNNSDTILIEEVPVKNGKARSEGEYSIDGCPGTGAKISLDWSGVTKQKPRCILPTGKVVDTLKVDGQEYHATVTGIGNIVIFFRAEELQMTGTESVQDIGSNKALMEKIERIRGTVAVQLGMVNTVEDAVNITPYQPFVAVVSLPADYTGLNGNKINASEINVVSRLVFMQKVHKTYPISAAVGIGAAARIPGTVVYEIMNKQGYAGKRIVIGHPSGSMDVESEGKYLDGKAEFSRLAVFRTARRIMDGQVYVKKTSL